MTIKHTHLKKLNPHDGYWIVLVKEDNAWKCTKYTPESVKKIIQLIVEVLSKVASVIRIKILNIGMINCKYHL